MGKSDAIRVGITTGDYNGVGPEIIVKTFMDRRMFDGITPILYGHSEIVKSARKTLQLVDFQYQSIESADDASGKKFFVIDILKDEPVVQPGEKTSQAGSASYLSLKAAVEDLASNKIDVLVTVPINKDLIQSEDFKFPGHTEYLADMSNVEDHLMLLVANNLRVGVVTGHVPIKEVSEKLTTAGILSKLQLLNDSLIRDFGISRPKIAVMGLNPHAGDNGLLGDEEKDIILPAIRQAEEMGIYAFGPYGADGFFGSRVYNTFDGILAMYHDQGLGPFKALAFDQGVNFTSGLPIVRTSPDHGTAYDIAGTGEADENSFRQAVFLAVDVYKQRIAFKELMANPLEISLKKSE
ncbi:MAG: 4-hydroxythreonine-4-phosphate dehydrogenase PdxA [Flavobacteriales bacterium]|nr:4-hydroxythreonine-4-phosphate dehydrogenase PdxA [Flavobacteriales bacterium]